MDFRGGVQRARETEAGVQGGLRGQRLDIRRSLRSRSASK
jgi:hypothetical protein